jgi:glutathione S-transferase kappa 1
MLPQRALHFVKQRHGAAALAAAMHWLFREFWVVHSDLTTADGLASRLAAAPAGFDGRVRAVADDDEKDAEKHKKMFTPQQVREIVDAAASPDCKARLADATARALAQGAYGLPWFWVTDAEGKGVPFFGSDR